MWNSRLRRQTSPLRRTTFPCEPCNNTTAGTVNSTSQGAAFIINEEGDSPTIQTAFYFFFGHVDVKMKIASGTGIISSIVFLSDVLDEIDWVCCQSLLNDMSVPSTDRLRRRELVHTTMKSKPTTLARITPQATTARPIPTSPLHVTSSTHTVSIGPLSRFNGLLTVTSSVPWHTTMHLMEQTSRKRPWC